MRRRNAGNQRVDCRLASVDKEHKRGFADPEILGGKIRKILRVIKICRIIPQRPEHNALGQRIILFEDGQNMRE